MIGNYNNLSDGLKNVKKVLKNVSTELTGMLDEWNDTPIDRHSKILSIASDVIKSAIDVQDIIDDIYEEEHPDEDE